MEETGVSQINVVETSGIVGGSESPPDFSCGVCCSEEVSVETPGRDEDCPSNLDSGELDLVDAKTGDDKAFTKEVILLMQALNTLATPEEKLAALRRMYADQLEKSRCLQKQVKVLQKKQSQIVKEKVHLQREHGKAILARSKMESLCRDLHTHNKTLRDDYSQRSREYEEQRKEDMQRLQVTRSAIEVQMEQYSSQNAMLRQENLELSEKLKKLIEQYELREEHMQQVLKHKDLQQELMTNKFERNVEVMKQVEEKHQREKDFLLKDATESRHRLELMRDQDTHHKQQLSLYMDKFEEFQSTLAKSNEAFTTYRQEMEKMSKKTRKLEKETTQWRSKWQSNNQALLQMTEEKMLRDGQFKAQQEKQQLLEKLCRALQQERSDLNKQLIFLQEQGGKEGTANLQEHGGKEKWTANLQEQGEVEEGTANLLQEGQGGKEGTANLQEQGEVEEGTANLHEQGEVEEGTTNLLQEGQGGKEGTENLQEQGCEEEGAANPLQEGQGGKEGTANLQEQGGAEDVANPLGPPQLTEPSPAEGSGSMPGKSAVEIEAEGIHQASRPPALEEELSATTDLTTTSLHTAPATTAATETAAALPTKEEIRDEV